MTTINSIDQITEFLKESNLHWLLPILRQDFVVWNSLNNPDFLAKLIQLKPSGSEISAEDFSPGRLALLALNQIDDAKKGAWDLLESVDKQVLQTAYGNFNNQDLLTTGSQNLADVGLTALALAENYRTSNSWSSLIDCIEKKPGSHWQSPLTCLYGMVGKSAGLLVALVQPGADSTRIESAVHTVLSNPINSDDQIDILLGLCHGIYGDLLPARERIILVHSLSEQCPESAAVFCRKWLEIHPYEYKSIGITALGYVENLNQSSELLFRVFVSNIAGASDNLSELLINEKDLTQQISTAAITHYSSQISKYRSDKSLPLELSALRDQLDQINATNLSPQDMMKSQAELALILSSHGFIDEALQLIPDADSPLPDDPHTLYAIAVVSYTAGDAVFATEAAAKLIEISDQIPQAIPMTVWGDGLSLFNLGKLFIDLHKPYQASKILERACIVCPNNPALLKLLAHSYTSSHDDLKASETLRALVALDPENIDHLRTFAHSLESMGDWEAGLTQRTLMVEACQNKSATLNIEDIYAYAKCALNSNHPELTLQICADLVAQDQENYQALIYSGEAYLLVGDTQKGVDLLTRATQVSPHEANGWLALVNAQKKICPPDTVIETLTSASRAVPESPEIHFSLGELYLHDDAPSLALPELKSAQSLSPDNPQILLSYGQALKQIGHTEECRSVLSKAFKLDPHLPGLAQLYARLLVELNELETAISPLEVLISKKLLQDPTPYMDYARCILSLHKEGSAKHPPMKALIALNEVLQINPDLPEARALIAETLAANGDKEMAFQAYREALDTSLIEDRSWLERLSYGFGCVASSIGKHDIAIAALQEAGQVNPHNIVVFEALSDAYSAAGLPEDAIRAARNVLVINSEDPDNLAWFAKQVETLIRNEKSDPANPSSIAKSVAPEALNALAKAIHLAPTRTDLLVQLGFFQNTIDELAEAQSTFASIAALDYAAIDDLKTASDYLSSIGDHASAIACLENGISQDQLAVDDHDSSLYIKLAQEYVKNNDHTSAINTLDKAIQALPGDESLFSLKIDILLSLGQSIEALNCIETAIRSNAGLRPTADLLLLAAHINRSMGDFSAAIKYVQNGIDATRNERDIANLASLSPQCLTQIAEIYRALIQPDQAYQILQQNPAVKASAFVHVQDYLDFICLHTELALETGEQIRPDIQEIQPQPSDPSFPRVMAITARLMNKAGNYKQAEQIYQIALNNFVNHDYSSDLPAWSVTHVKYLTKHAIIEAALDLGLWDQANSAIQQVLGSCSNEPLSYLTFAKSIVLQAEFYNFCEIVAVNKHKPSPDSITQIAHTQVSDNLERARSILDQYKDALIFNSNELNLESIDRWQARAIIALNLTEGSHLDPTEVLVHQRTPQDAAAMIYYLHSHLQDHEQDITSQIIKVARSHSRNPAVLLQVASAIHEENPSDASKSLQSVLESNPYAKNPFTAFCNIFLAKIALNLKEYNVARKSIEAAIDFWQDEPDWHLLAARIYEGTSDYTNIIGHLLEATKLAPQNLSCQLALGKAYFETAYNDPRLLKQAQNSFENALEIEPKDVTALVSLANIQCLLDDIDNAELNARTAQMLDPNRVDIYQLLSKIANKNNDFQFAYEYANKAIQLNPKDVHSTIILAQSLSALGRHGEALAKLNSMLPATTDSKLLYLERVNIIRKVNGIRAGVDELKSLVNSYPQDFSILNALAKSYVEAGEIESAIDIAQQALKSPTDQTPPNEQANLHLLIGQAFRQSGELDQAIYHLNEAIQLSPDRLEPYIELGLARKERREYQQALQIFEQATSIDPEDPRAPFQAGLALKESKDYKSSEMMLRRAVSLAPNDLNIRRQLAAVVALNLVHNPRTGRI